MIEHMLELAVELPAAVSALNKLTGVHGTNGKNVTAIDQRLNEPARANDVIYNTYRCLWAQKARFMIYSMCNLIAQNRW